MDFEFQKQQIESLINERIAQSMQRFKEELVKIAKTEINSFSQKTENKITQGSFLSETNGGADSGFLQRPQQLNYGIAAPDDPNQEQLSAIAAEINFNSSELHFLGLQNKELSWVIGTDGGGPTPPHPWQILLRTIPETETTPQQTEYKIESNSRLYSGLGNWNNIEVDGLGQWNNASVGYIVLSGVVNDGICTEASIQKLQDSLPDRIEFVDGVQVGFVVQLGYIYNSGNGSFLVRQNSFHDFTLIQSCIDGNIALYPFAT